MIVHGPGVGPGGPAHHGLERRVDALVRMKSFSKHHQIECLTKKARAYNPLLSGEKPD